MEAFSEKGLNSDIIKAISELGFVKPTPIQEKTIPAILTSGNDIIALAQTGTGKTAGFGLPILELIDRNNKQTQALMLCPTRELCLQITKDLQNFSKYMQGINIVAVYGGTSIVGQINDLKRGAHIVVGTPGRTLDLIERKALKVNNVCWLVLDEADEMLQMGFKDELDSILEGTPKEKQTLLFSATMPDGVRKIAQNYMTNPDEIAVGRKNQGSDNIKHIYYLTKATNKYLVLKRIADINPNIYGIVFCRTRQETKEIADKLIQDGYNADALHGDLSQSQRDFVMQRFRMKALQILVATDVAARGLDVNELTHVINYNLPDDPEVYIHRSGRTGRAGKSGTSIAIIHSRETHRLKDIEKLSQKKFEYAEVPGGREICEKRLFSLVDKFENIEIDNAQIESFLPAIMKKLVWLDRDELIKRFISVEFNRFIDYYKDAPDLNIHGQKDEKKPIKEKRSGRAEAGYSRFHINIGSKRNITTAHLIGMINDATRTKEIAIGKIDIMRNFSFFEVDKQYEKTIVEAFNGFKRDNIPVEVQLANPNSMPEVQKNKRKPKPKGDFKPGNQNRDKNKDWDNDRSKDRNKKKKSRR